MLIIPLCDIMTLTEDWIQSEKLKQKKEFHSTCQEYMTQEWNIMELSQSVMQILSLVLTKKNISRLSIKLKD